MLYDHTRLYIHNKIENCHEFHYMYKKTLNYILTFHQTICHWSVVEHFLLDLHKRLNVVSDKKPIISLSSCILYVNVD